VAKPLTRDDKKRRRQQRARKSLWLWISGLALCVVLSAWRTTPELWFLSDDAWISFRYSWNLVHGNGLTWDPSMPHVEGYSNLLWVLWSAVGIVAGAPLPVWAKGTGMVLTAGTVVCTALCVRTLGGSRPLAFAAAVMTSCSTLVVLWGVSGMETPLLCLLLTAGTWRALAEDRAIREGGQLRAWSLLFFALATITRVEGPIYLIIPVVIRLMRYRVEPFGRRDLIHLALMCAPALGQFVFRVAYYRDWLSNTYYVKGSRHPTVSQNIICGIRYLIAALTGNPLMGLLWVVGGGIAVYKRHGALLLPMAVCALFVIKVGGDEFGHLRFLTPAVPTMMVAGVLGVGHILQRLRSTKIEIQSIALMVLLGMGTVMLDISAHKIVPTAPHGWQKMAIDGDYFSALSPPYATVKRDPIHRMNPFRESELHGMGTMVEWYLAYLIENVPPGEAFVFMDVGLVGYTMVDSTLLDGRGLNWRPAARLLGGAIPRGEGGPGTPESTAVLDSFEKHAPAVLCLQHENGSLFGPIEALLIADGVLEEDYEFVALVPYWGINDRIAIYRRAEVAEVSEEVIQARYERMIFEDPLMTDWNGRIVVREIDKEASRPEAPFLGSREPDLPDAGEFDPELMNIRDVETQ